MRLRAFSSSSSPRHVCKASMSAGNGTPPRARDARAILSATSSDRYGSVMALLLGSERQHISAYRRLQLPLELRPMREDLGQDLGRELRGRTTGGGHLLRLVGPRRRREDALDDRRRAAETALGRVLDARVGSAPANHLGARGP